MNTEAFESALKRDGFDEISTGGFPAGHALGEHVHPYSLRGLVLEGEFTIAVDGVKTSYCPGDIFVLDRERIHSEWAGPDGVRFLIGRKR